MTNSRMKAVAWSVLVLSAALHPALAQAQEEPYFAILVAEDGTASIKNLTERQFLVEGYALTSSSNSMDEGGWYTIRQQFLDDPDRIVDLLGPAFLTQELLVSALTTPDGQFFIEGGPLMDWVPGLSIPIGKPFGEDIALIKQQVASGDQTWRILLFDDIAISQNPIWFVPEPRGLAMAALAGLGLLVLARCRNHRRFVM